VSESCRAKRGYPCDKAFCAALFDELFAHQQELSGRLLTLDIDAVWYSDDWSGQQGPLFSPELWRQWIKPRFAGIIEKTHKAGKRVILHCCGNLEAFIPELIEIGVDCLQCVQPEAMDPMTLKREFGKDMCFWGCVPIQGLPALSPAGIRTYVQRLREKMAVGGGYICSPAKALDETIPLDKAIALIESVADITLQ